MQLKLVIRHLCGKRGRPGLVSRVVYRCHAAVSACVKDKGSICLMKGSC